MPSDGVLFFPLSRRGMGSGHLRRCFNTARDMRIPASLLIDDSSPDALLPEDWKGVIPGFPGGSSVLLTSDALKDNSLSGARRTLAVFDRRQSTRADILPWAENSTPVLLDDDGPARNLAPFVLDSIPGPRGSDANEASPSWLSLPPRGQKPNPEGPILLSFGGSDPAGITISLIHMLLDTGIPASRIHLTLPPGVSVDSLPRGVSILDAPGNLKSHLKNYGMVFCSYGLTAWEAIAAGCAVITADPTDYHASLSKSAGFPGIGRMSGGPGRPSGKNRKMLIKLMGSPENLVKSAEKLALSLETGSENNLSRLLDSLEAPPSRCLACGKALPPVIARFPRKSYYRCQDCGITGLYRFEKTLEDEYGTAYFQEEYKKQYGKSYLEDFQHIKSIGVSRLELISRRGKEGGTMLDIGCAFGPFLEAAREAGFHPHGIDISPDAAAYVRDTLGIPAVSAVFPGEKPESMFPGETFDIITLWYVIEHFTDLQTVLSAVNRLLKQHGVLALSTPNAAGISARRSLHRFLRKSPGDHYSVWTPETAVKLLSIYGFKVYKIKVTGHHPERFGLFPKSRFFQSFLGLISRLFALGDTFEVYAVKEHSLV